MLPGSLRLACDHTWAINAVMLPYLHGTVQVMIRLSTLGTSVPYG